MSDERSAPALCGWFDQEIAQQDRTAGPRVVCDQAAGNTIIDGHAFFIQLKSNRCEVHVVDDTVTAVIGEPRDENFRTLTAADVARLAIDGNADANWRRLRGRFAVVHLHLRQGKTTLVTDRFAVIPLCWSIDDSKIAFSDRADGVPQTGPREIDPQAIFNYVYFHVIPAPRTVFRAVQRMEAATRLSFDARGLHSTATWVPAFTAKENFNIESEGDRFRTLLTRSIEREITTPRTGAFLSGGTDSSTVVGLLAKVTGEPVDCFSIGFDASGYDEMSYARLAARHFNSRHHEHYVTPSELIRAIPLVATHYDQPFGNSSALPVYYCAHLAHEHGVDKLLAGDGVTSSLEATLDTLGKKCSTPTMQFRPPCGGA